MGCRALYKINRVLRKLLSWPSTISFSRRLLASVCLVVTIVRTLKSAACRVSAA